ncbi:MULTISPECIES: ATP-dependent DNA ligase [unclassified Curtobacterium]|uniref:DUF7882 family protein n=1 Tax=unclassified Curtobacterium TaxID=257496 RepID=UPI000DA9692E|nr:MULTISPECIES: ATP-dependent DNA ligase [unclassified Curtobacterium]PZE34977.1 ATP-dependent DNA ligase [Curtobacterium sp. MCPF17_031]PZF09721.1 ATP-dependent DNA ligase [Curtobacterium sp. MCPF17_011]
MGYLIYDGQSAEIQMDDRTLAHLQIVIISKLRRQESFAFSWKEPVSKGDGRSTIWIFPTVSLRFKFEGSRAPAVNEAWLDVLKRSVNSNGGLQMIPEPTGSGSVDGQ